MAFTNIFKHADYNKILEEKGYVSLPYLNEEELDKILKFFRSKHPDLPKGMYASSHAPDFSFRKEMNDFIQENTQRAANATFEKTRLLGATFMVKSKGENGRLDPHQDWSIVDESKFNSYNIWLPLVDVNEENGTLLILPNSHQLFENIRGLNIPSSFQNVQKEVWKYLIPINMKAGEALVYDHRLLHASAINQTNSPRIAIVGGLIPEAAEMRYYFGRENYIEAYACGPEFYFSQDIGKGPAGLEMISSQTNNNPVISEVQLKNTYEKRPSFKDLIKKLFSAKKAN